MIGASGCAILIGALAGCGAPAPTLSSGEAIDEYAPLLDEVESVLDEAYPEISWTRDGEQRVQGGGDGEPCVVVFPTLESPTSLWGAAGGWDAVAEVLDPVLSERGFPPLAEDELQGGWTGVSAVGDDGADIRMWDKSSTTIALRVDVTDEGCAAP
ncbi:hypothetical protein [Labedella endophytica]|uniref:Uncharacterized protein n=1 Tax=Labedella endophytica TaxID=1523160 RepID=A0A3S0X3M6_9MICO|nr:hypothetical protein [Labedella endophytica]RUQ96915.1 hypothetical protein ELQ94_16840 [Labedella endophytica]